eukprot:2699124-Prymnesium_polylepis.1
MSDDDFLRAQEASLATDRERRANLAAEEHLLFARSASIHAFDTHRQEQEQLKAEDNYAAALSMSEKSAHDISRSDSLRRLMSTGRLD